MDIYHFSVVLYQNLYVYIRILFIVASVYFIFFRKFFFSIFDPICFNNFVSSGFATTTVLFLYKMKVIKWYYLCNYLATLLIFYSVFFMFGKRIKRNEYLCHRNEKCILKPIEIPERFFIYFEIFSVLNILSILFQYVVFGIPLFLKSRLIILTNGGIVFGIIIRLQGVFASLSTFMCYYIMTFAKGKKKQFGQLYFIFLIVTALLSGSKGSFLGYIFIFAVFAYYVQYNNSSVGKILTNRFFYILIIISMFLGLGIIYIQQGVTSFDFLVKQLFLRFAAYGDGYVYAYPLDRINLITKKSFVQFLFGDFLSTYRLNMHERGIGFGFELYNIVNKVYQTSVGPNARFNLVGLAYFGFGGSLILSLISGIMFTIARNCFVKAVNTNIYHQLFVYYMYNLICNIESDIIACISQLTTYLFLQIIALISIVFFIRYSKCKDR